ncbi:protein FAM169B-like [Mugil cephalus]|uniref:protein FAM169B-like n=1 Tax=Mugil cephalus TaxID=48193 RepID=UPI001FB6E5AF|nr:protein FAM169B-like [Mugil cephalus]XP_047451398.1 protein FAM169B-like [Mugil cephalus]XP_047451400.1 protein FAM169B-like [Mugil cephalus]
MYPVDLPAVEDSDLASTSEYYLSSLESGNDGWFQSSQTSKVPITSTNVSQLQLFGDDQPTCTVLALHPPDDQTQVVAVYLLEKWWCLDDVLRTSTKSRSGLVSVQSITERLIVFLLSQVVERPSQEAALFSRHPPTESCKVLWRDSRAVGFYTVKHKGSLCDGWSSSCYLLPVLDTVLVRRSCRRRGFGLQILEDFCSSFSAEEFLGVSSPLSPSMAAVFRRFLQQHEEHRERLYEVEAPGSWTQRRNIWLNIQLGRYSIGVNEESNQTSGEGQENEADDSSQTRRRDQTSDEQPTKLCDLSQREISPSIKISETGCRCPAAALDRLDSRRPNRLLNTNRSLRSKDFSFPRLRRKGPEETHKSGKRARRT